MKYCVIYDRLRDGEPQRTRLSSLPKAKERLEQFSEKENPTLVSKNDLGDEWFDER